MAYKDRQWCKERGICTRCKKQEAFNGHSLCADCMYYYTEYYHSVRKQKPDYKICIMEADRKRRVKKKTNGICRCCSKPVCERSTIYCDHHRILYNKRALERYYKNHVHKTEEEMKVIKAEATKRIKEGYARWVAERMRLKAEKKLEINNGCSTL